MAFGELGVLVGQIRGSLDKVFPVTHGGLPPGV